MTKNIDIEFPAGDLGSLKKKKLRRKEGVQSPCLNIKGSRGALYFLRKKERKDLGSISKEKKYVSGSVQDNEVPHAGH